jgi:GNAT superfamily N-acetyltransferase
VTLTFHQSRPEDPEAVPLIEELSAALAEITGSSGKNSFSNADMDDAKSVFLLATDEGQAVACGALRRIDDSTAELKRMYSKKRRSGIGALLLAKLELEARLLGYERIQLETRKVNEVAVKFYLKHGYSVIPNFGKYVGNAAAVCFEKSIRPDQTLRSDVLHVELRPAAENDLPFLRDLRQTTMQAPK